MVEAFFGCGWCGDFGYKVATQSCLHLWPFEKLTAILLPTASASGAFFMVKLLEKWCCTGLSSTWLSRLSCSLLKRFKDSQSFAKDRKIIFSVRRAELDSLILLVSLANINEKVLTDIPKNCLFEFERKSFNWMQSYTKAVKVYIESESSRRLFNHVCEESCHLIWGSVNIKNILIVTSTFLGR